MNIHQVNCFVLQGGPGLRKAVTTHMQNSSQILRLFDIWQSLEVILWTVRENGGCSHSSISVFQIDDEDLKYNESKGKRKSRKTDDARIQVICYEKYRCD